MIVTWTTLRARRPVRSAPWQPQGALWWQAGHSSAGRAEPPPADGRWWSVLATWPDRAAAQHGPTPDEDLAVWHVVLEGASWRGDAALAGGARPFDTAPRSGRTEGAVAVITLAGPSRDSGREREFFRRFLHLGRSVETAPGQLAALVQAPDDGAVLTFTAWRDQSSALDWAYAQPLHAGAVERQRTHALVETTGFLRCAVLSSSGTLGDLADPLDGLHGSVRRVVEAPVP